MKYRSLNQPTAWRSFREALREGIAPGGGLFVPESIPVMPEGFQVGASLPEIGAEMMAALIGSDLSKSTVYDIAVDALNFEIPLVAGDDGMHLLELFHGPTAAFKDVGARMMSRLLQSVSNEKLTVLVATSGDTGSAVAQGFLDVEGIDVVILYPSGRISHIQEQQLTTVGRNVTALEIAGSFDDCQALVKRAFEDQEIQQSRPLTSANSINIGRWLPQSIYYAWASAQLNEPLRFVVPSGNFGNIAAGVLAQKMGVPIHSFVSAVNSNESMAEYLRTGSYLPKSSVQTISNAMDVGDPSNRPRLEWLYQGSFAKLKAEFSVIAVGEEETKKSMLRFWNAHHELICPHTAVGVQAAQEVMQGSADGVPTVVLATAHPAKFGAVVSNATGQEPFVPEALKGCLMKTKEAKVLPASFDAFKAFLLDA
jgi:threonine synthase